MDKDLIETYRDLFNKKYDPKVEEEQEMVEEATGK
jgi:hypothetical protein